MNTPVPKKASVMGEAACRIWSKGVVTFSRGLADREFQRRAEFAAESSDPQFKQVRTAYERVLWRFVMDQTPDALLDTINKVRISRPDLSDAQNCQVTQYYLLSRAVFLAGLKYGKAYEPEWYRGFADEFAVAARLNDMAIFEALSEVKQKRKRKETQPLWGQLRFFILLAWLAGGLWKLPNDKKRADQLNRLFDLGKAEGLTKKGFQTARERLKLSPPILASNSPSS